MINPQKDIASFTMRFVQQRWKDTDGEPQLQWKGYIRHIQSDDEITFVDFSHAVQFIQEHLVALTANATSDSSESDQQAYKYHIPAAMSYLRRISQQCPLLLHDLSRRFPEDLLSPLLNLRQAVCRGNG